MFRSEASPRVHNVADIRRVLSAFAVLAQARVALFLVLDEATPLARALLFGGDLRDHRGDRDLRNHRGDCRDLAAGSTPGGALPSIPLSFSLAGRKAET